MKSALRRELEKTGWQALGFGLGLLALLIGGLIWGTGIESKVSDVARRQHRDHKRIVRIESARPLHDRPVRAAPGGDADQPSTGHEQPGPPSGGPPENGSHPSPPQHPGVSNPPPSPPAVRDVPPVASPAQPSLPPQTEAPLQPVRETVTGAVEGVKETVCSVNALGVRVCLP